MSNDIDVDNGDTKAVVEFSRECKVRQVVM